MSSQDCRLKVGLHLKKQAKTGFNFFSTPEGRYFHSETLKNRQVKEQTHLKIENPKKATCKP